MAPQASWPPDVPAESLEARIPQPGVLSQASSARNPQPGVLSKIPQPGFLSQESPARSPQPGVLSQESSAKIPQPGFLSQESPANLFGVSRWNHFLYICKILVFLIVSLGFSQPSAHFFQGRRQCCCRQMNSQIPS